MSARYTAQIPLIEGRFREAILKAERDVASTAAGNCGHEKPGTAASPWRLVAWSLRAGPGNGNGGGTWADNATAERREAYLPVAREGPCLASVASRVTARHLQGWTSLGAPPIPSGIGSDEGEKEGRRTRTENEPGIKKPGRLTW